ncbi:rRNA methyltransferase [Hyphodiscus hymeniophilus]|uniref:rRNA methyltransferase 2, mitochondrial n=1 Tax=Hyphodiscus hymeniophilus TaxID=353542 RepID=A0A9P6VRQ5_9HELO|nr:rRNA methyltransferase [Hyphodiscus hymeniophilus]
MDSSISYNDDVNIKSHLTKSQALEHAYQEGLLKADLIVKDEAARRLRLRILLLENENDDLHEQLALADDRIDILEQEGEELRGQVDEAQEDARKQESELRAQARELNNLKAELISMNGVTMDSAKVLTEKLALAREIATLKPELEHLRSQSAYQQTVLTEKLALERQVSTLEVELETEKRASKRVSDKSKNKDREIDLQQQLEDLQKDLAREKREREKESREALKEIEASKRALKRAAEKGDDNEREDELEQELKDLRKDLAREKRERANERKEAEKDLDAERNAARRAAEKGSNKERDLELQEQIEDLRKELSREKREAEKARREAEKELEATKRVSKRAAEKVNNASEKDQELQEKLDELQNNVAKERREKEKARKDAEKELSASETRKEVLESKLEQMRTKLRSVKEELKESQTQLAQARTSASKVGPSRGDVPAKNSRKRGATEMSTDDAIGTPDGVAARRRGPAVKRGRPDQTMLGEKSMFSITPFLNKTVNMMPDSPIEEEEVEEDAASNELINEEPQQEDQVAIAAPVEAGPSPSASKTKGKKRLTEEKAALKKQPLGEAQSGTNKKLAAKKPRAISTLEKVTEEEADENDASAPASPNVNAARPDISKASKAQMKNTEEAQPQKKKRKLLGGGKTLFDEEDGEATKRPIKVNLGPPRLLGKGGLAGPKGGLKGGLGAASAFGGFSPLKKDRRGIDAKYKLFKRGQTVVDLGYAPGSWSQVAVERTKPSGRIVGIDIIPAQPPKGVSTIQGNFLSIGVQEEVKKFLRDPNRGRPKPQPFSSYTTDSADGVEITDLDQSYIDMERHADEKMEMDTDGKKNRRAQEEADGRCVDVVLSDMSAPWEQTTGFWKRSLSNPYYRMMNTSGINFKDHAGSMDLCAAALQFAQETLRSGGHLVCKFYQGAEDKELEAQLKKMFGSVHREKPESSRSESKEAYFVALRRKVEVKKNADDDTQGKSDVI